MIDGFHDVQFPTDLAFGSAGGPEFMTDITALSNGQEVRNARWQGARRRFLVSLGPRAVGRVRELIAFFEARQGRRFAFRFKDPFDHSSGPGESVSPTDQEIGTGDGVTSRFGVSVQVAPSLPPRTNILPVVETIGVAVDGVVLTAGQFTYDNIENQVVLAQPPAIGSTVTAGFEFDVPVRFESDRLVVERHAGGGEGPEIGLVEVAR